MPRASSPRQRPSNPAPLPPSSLSRRRGWKENGGGLWSEDSPAIAVNTEYLTFVKDLTKPEKGGGGPGAMMPVASNTTVATTTTASAVSAAKPMDQGEIENMSAALGLAHAVADASNNLPPLPPSTTETAATTTTTSASGGGMALPGKLASFCDGLDAAAGVPIGAGATPAGAGRRAGPSGAEALLAGLSAGGGGGGDAGTAAGSGDNLDDLVGTLLGQLNTDSGREQFKALVDADGPEPNVLGVQLEADGSIKKEIQDITDLLDALP